MASTYSSLKIELIGTGDQSGTWGNTTNINLGTAIEEAITGSADVPFSSADVTLTLTNSNGSQTARNLRLNLTGTSGGARNLIVPAIEKFYIVNNNLADDVTVKNATGSGTVIKAGTSGFVFNNATDVVATINYFSGSFGPITTTTVSATSISDSGNLTFTGTGNRILGDFTNATIANRVAFQSSTTNGNTVIGALPNGTATGSSLQVYNNATPTNASLGSWEVSSTLVTLASTITGSGTYLPLTFNTNGAESMRISVVGGVFVGSAGTDPGAGNLQVSGAVVSTRINPRSLSLSSTSGAITPASDLYDQVNYSLTGSSSFSNPSGTPVNGQKLSIRIYAASLQTISSWSSSTGGYRAIGVTLPTSAQPGKTIYVGCIWNSTDSFWDVVAVATQI
jgi:hypothetical protein